MSLEHEKVMSVRMCDCSSSSSAGRKREKRPDSLTGANLFLDLWPAIISLKPRWPKNEANWAVFVVLLDGPPCTVMLVAGNCVTFKTGFKRSIHSIYL